MLRFSDFAAAAQSIAELEKTRQRFEAEGDKKGVSYCRELGRLGRRRAEAMSRSRRLRPARRREKRELADWFRIWLETPRLFEHWLELRRRSAEFAALVAELEAEHRSGE